MVVDPATGVGVAAIIAIVSLLAVSPTFSAKTTPALVPWAVLVGTLHAIGRTPAYPPLWAELFALPLIVPLSTAVVGGSWALVTLAVGLWGGDDATPHLTAAGYGAALPVVVLAIDEVVASGAPLIGPVVTTVAAAAIFAVVLYLAVAYVRPNAITILGVGGALFLFGLALDGLAAILVLDPRTDEVPFFDETVSLVGGDPLQAAGLYAVVRLLLAPILLIALSDVARRHSAGHLAVAVGAALGIAVGGHTILLALMGLL